MKSVWNIKIFFFLLTYYYLLLPHHKIFHMFECLYFFYYYYVYIYIINLLKISISHCVCCCCEPNRNHSNSKSKILNRKLVKLKYAPTRASAHEQSNSNTFELSWEKERAAVCLSSAANLALLLIYLFRWEHLPTRRRFWNRILSFRRHERLGVVS